MAEIQWNLLNSFVIASNGESYSEPEEIEGLNNDEEQEDEHG